MAVTNALAYTPGRRIGDRSLNRALQRIDTSREFKGSMANRPCPLLAAQGCNSCQSAGAPTVRCGATPLDGWIVFPFAAAQPRQERLCLARASPRFG